MHTGLIVWSCVGFSDDWASILLFSAAIVAFGGTVDIMIRLTNYLREHCCQLPSKAKKPHSETENEFETQLRYSLKGEAVYSSAPTVMFQTIVVDYSETVNERDKKNLDDAHTSVMENAAAALFEGWTLHESLRPHARNPMVRTIHVAPAPCAEEEESNFSIESGRVSIRSDTRNFENMDLYRTL